jgi:hypothetical protein
MEAHSTLATLMELSGSGGSLVLAMVSRWFLSWFRSSVWQNVVMFVKFLTVKSYCLL